MKKTFLVTLFIISLGINNPILAAEQHTQNLSTSTQANNCPTNCTSCWEQCTKNDDCGVDHKCISTACGNRCVKN